VCVRGLIDFARQNQICRDETETVLFLNYSFHSFANPRIAKQLSKSFETTVLSLDGFGSTGFTMTDCTGPSSSLFFLFFLFASTWSLMSLGKTWLKYSSIFYICELSIRFSACCISSLIFANVICLLSPPDCIFCCFNTNKIRSLIANDN